jgi:hypothetical protein
MKKLLNGNLNEIGVAGTETAAEMYLIRVRQHETERQEWVEYEKWWDIVSNSVLGLSMLAMIFVVSRRRPTSEIEDHELGIWGNNY